MWFPAEARLYPEHCEKCGGGKPIAWFRKEWLCPDCLNPPLDDFPAFFNRSNISLFEDEDLAESDDSD